MSAKELLFKATPGFGKYKRFLGHAMGHPAKMNTNLLRYLIREFTVKGDVILDPMAGSGNTGVVASLMERNAVCVELEEKFYGWMKKAKQKAENTPSLMPKGKMLTLCGDARKLSELLANADVVLTSPPYVETKTFHDVDFMRRIAKDQSEKLRRGEVKGHYYSKEARSNELDKVAEGKIQNPNNIAVLPHGKIDAVVTSPPYSEGIGHAPGDNASDEYNERLKMQKKYTHQMTSEGNIGALKHGNVDAIVTSPPYGEAQKGCGIAKEGYRGYKHLPTDLVGNRSYMPDKFASPQNISKMKKETYLEAMLQVYVQMQKVLKPNGLCIIVIKPFIRNKKVVDLPYQNWQLMEKAGFKLEKLFKLRLKNTSFWRTLYRKKYPDVPKINHEYILICRNHHIFSVNPA